MEVLICCATGVYHYFLETLKSSNTLIIGSIVQGRYQILSKLKGGALSRTYLVQDLAQPNDPKCVLKHYPYNKEIPRLYKTNMRLFLKEAKHLQVLSVHPQIPRLIDYFGITDQGWYLIQELVDGRLLNNTMPLSEYSNNCWSAYQVAQFIHDLCETLQFIHGQKIIHCDLKPNNIIRRSSDDRLVIIDFGSAQYIPGFQTNEDLTVTSLRTKITVSPSGYLAPEQMTGQPQPCSDFYALGIMAIQAWTGLDPARMKKDNHTGEVVWDQYVKIDDPQACRELVGIVSKLVQPDIGDRYQHTRDILADLDVFLNTFHPADEEIEINYDSISFEDTTLFQRPDLPLKGLTDSIIDKNEISKDFVLPPEASKETFIQDDSTGFNQTFIQDQSIDFEDDSIEELQGRSHFTADETEDNGYLSASDLPSKLKRHSKASFAESWSATFGKSFRQFKYEVQQIKEAYERWTAARAGKTTNQAIATEQLAVMAEANPGMMFRGIV
jgi:serine/threonine-protein kinase